MTPGDSPVRSRLARALTWLSAAALAVMMFWTIADIVLRTLFRLPLRGSVALVETMLVLVAVLALAECFGRDEQIKVDVFDHMVSGRGLSFLKLLGDVATLVFVLLLAATMVQPLMDAWRFWDIKPDIPVPIAALLGVMELALVASAFVLVVKIARALRRSTSPGREA